MSNAEKSNVKRPSSICNAVGGGSGRRTNQGLWWCVNSAKGKQMRGQKYRRWSPRLEGCVL